MDHMLFFLSQAEQFPDHIDVMQTFAEQHNIPFDRARIDQHVKDLKERPTLQDDSPSYPLTMTHQTPIASFTTQPEQDPKTFRERDCLHAQQGNDVMARIIARRKALGLTQAEFARRLGVSVRTYQEWEQGRRRPSAMAEKGLQHMLSIKPPLHVNTPR